MIRALALLGVLGAMALSSVACADKISDEAARKQEAKRCRDAGVTAWERGDYLIALDQFDRAYASFPAPNLLFNKGQVLSDLGRDLEALEVFERFLAEAQNPPAEFSGVSKSKIAILSKRVAHLDVRALDAGAEIAVDGHAVGKAPLSSPIRVSAGNHQVSAQLAGFEPALLFANPRSGETAQVRIALHKIGEDNRPLKKKWWLWTAVSGAAAVVATSIALGVVYGTRDPRAADVVVVSK